jgi:hypothetical protein
VPSLGLFAPFLGKIHPLFQSHSDHARFVSLCGSISPFLGEFKLYHNAQEIQTLLLCRLVFHSRIHTVQGSVLACWLGPFLSSLQGHDDGLSMQFAVGFDGKIAHVGSFNFVVTEESIVAATKLPRMGDRWFKNHQLPRLSYNRVFKPEFKSISVAKGYAKEWINIELVNPLIVITRLITCEGRYSTFKACHFRLLAHFLFNKPLKFPFYFLKILEKMSSQVRKNVTNPHNSLFHHGLIKLLVLADLEKQGKNWDAFIYQFANPHLTVKTDRKPLSLQTISPSRPHSPRTPNSLTQTLSLSEK